jgi:hypothetical protein
MKVFAEPGRSEFFARARRQKIKERERGQLWAREADYSI